MEDVTSSSINRIARSNAERLERSRRMGVAVFERLGKEPTKAGVLVHLLGGTDREDGVPLDREVDRALQRLRRAKKIKFQSKRGATGWVRT